MTRAARGRAAVLLVAIASLSAAALAQRSDPRHPSTILVGVPQGPAATVRVDARRSGLSRVALPRAPLRKEWEVTTGAPVEVPPIVTDKEIVVLSHGDLTWLAPDGQELARAPLRLGPTSPPAVLSDGTVVFVTTQNEVRGYTHAAGGHYAARFQTRLGGERVGAGQFVTPLALDDGGVAVAGTNELVVLDADGDVRARTATPEPLTGALLAAGGKIIATARTGVVYAWTPGRDASRIGSFDGAIDQGATLTEDGTLLAVVGGRHLYAMDPRQGIAVPRATIGGAGYYLGPVALRGKAAYLMAAVPGHTFAIALDPAGTETLRVPLSTPPIVLAPDGGPGAFGMPAHTGVVIDRSGTLAFATPDGVVGVVSPGGMVSSMPVPPCTHIRGRGVTSLVPAGPGAFLVTCDNAGGTVVRVTSGT